MFCASVGTSISYEHRLHMYTKNRKQLLIPMYFNDYNITIFNEWKMPYVL